MGLLASGGAGAYQPWQVNRRDSTYVAVAELCWVKSYQCGCFGVSHDPVRLTGSQGELEWKGTSVYCLNLRRKGQILFTSPWGRNSGNTVSLVDLEIHQIRLAHWPASSRDPPASLSHLAISGITDYQCMPRRLGVED